MGSWGGDSLRDNLNTQYNLADLTWVGTAGCMVWLMIPGVGALYAGMSRKKHSVSLLFASMMCACLVTFQWWIWGYSFVFSHEAGDFWGKLDNVAGRMVMAYPSVGSSAVPDIVFCVFQGMFACVTGVLMLGGAHERARLGPMMVFLFIWITIVYCPIAEWTWNSEGWLAQLGALDFAGGGPVHMSSGVGALAYALICGKRRDPTATEKVVAYKPGSVFLVVFGTILLWFGWFGFNGGSTGNASIRSWYAIANTNVAAATGGLTYMLVEYAKTRKWSTVGMCCGIVAGLVGITPAAGFVPLYTSIVFGVVTAIACNLATYLKIFLRIDDGLDVFALHGIGGAVGSILTALFAADYISHLDGSLIAQGWMNHHYVQLPYQLAAIGSIYGWSFVVTSLILLIMNYIPGGWFKIRMSEEEEKLGSDRAQLLEYGVMFDDAEDLFAMGTVQGAKPYPDAYQYPRSPQSVPKENESPPAAERRSSSISVESAPPNGSSEPKPVAA